MPDIEKFMTDISDMKLNIREIHTLLVGQDGSGLCGQVKELKEKKADKEELKNHIENHKTNKGELKWAVMLVIAIAVPIAMKFIK
jgi:hypothetical protein